MLQNSSWETSLYIIQTKVWEELFCVSQKVSFTIQSIISTLFSVLFSYVFCICAESWSVGHDNIPTCLFIVFKLHFGHCWGLREWGQSSQGACKEEGVKRRKVKKKKRKKIDLWKQNSRWRAKARQLRTHQEEIQHRGKWKYTLCGAEEGLQT